MDKFIVSARKYRPQNFSTVVGQSHITTTLKNAINNNQLAHAFLFCGPRGVGKTTCARILAKTINCENRTADGEACNTCNSCTSFDNGTSLNIHELDAASNNSVDDIRALVEQVRFAPQAGEYKVYIVDEVHMLSAAAFNAFLKTLEEPPPYAIFILATTEKHKILPTILSRCQIFDFKRITITDTIEHLHEICEKEDIEAEKAALHIIAQKSEGAMRDSLSILDKIVSFTDGHLTYANTLEHLNILDEDYYFKLLEYLQAQQLSDALLLLDSILQKGFETDTFIDGFTEFIRNLLVSKDSKVSVLLEVADDFKEKYLSWAQKTDTGWLLATLNLLSETNMGLKTARNKKLFTEMLLIKLSYLQQAIELLPNGEKKKLMDNAKPVAFKALPILKLKASLESPSPKPTSSNKEAQLIIEEPRQTIKKIITAEKSVPESSISNTQGSDVKIISLAKIRAQVALKNNISAQAAIPFNLENLNECWNKYKEKLKLDKKHLTFNMFHNSSINMLSEDCFEILIERENYRQFIEPEREGILDHFKETFFNNNISYKITLNPNAKVEEVSEEVVLTSSQKYQQMSAQNPFISLLREKLKLDVG
ncbi:MAG TPA: DNA polymerase III subunit gamma/tau [Ferruginibacter sp.]|nr:DNA polymerase III subunit gamma/tau [Ferruginibacter sp.]HRE63846.1 DNA polymerase III subunit gamma/tau [Ferruginibacter sp.]